MKQRISHGLSSTPGLMASPAKFSTFSDARHSTVNSRVVGSRCPTPQIGCRTGRHENQRAVLLDQPATDLALTVNEALARSLSTEKAILQ